MTDPTPKKDLVKTPAKSSLPSKIQQGLPQALSTLRQMELTKGLPPASIVYGVAAGAFFAFAIFLMVRGFWIDGLLTMLPAGIFVGFAAHFIKYAGPKR